MKTTRKERLMPNSVPKYIRCYDNGGSTFDRYTVVFTGNYNKSGGYWYIGMSDNPFHPQGFGQHGSSNNRPIDRPIYGHIGRKIGFHQLPEDCRALVIRDYIELWNL